MDRKTRILLNALNRRSIPNKVESDTTADIQNICIAKEQTSLEDVNLDQSSQMNTPWISPKIQLNEVSSSNKEGQEIYDSRLRRTKRKLFEKEQQTLFSELPSSGSSEVASTVDPICENSDEENDSRSEYIPGTVSEESDDESGSYSISNDNEEYVNENLNEIPASKSPEPSSSTVNHTTDYGKYKGNGEVRKGNKKADFCYYCEASVLNFARHVTRNHTLEIDVQNIMSQPPGSKSRRQLLDLLRKKGNFLNSSTVQKPVQSLRVRTNMLACDYCLGFFSAKFLWRHKKKCHKSNTENHHAELQNILLSNSIIDPHLKNTVFPRMRADEISIVAKKDPLICAYGARYLHCHREKHFINVVSRKMREISRLLIELRKMDSSIHYLYDALKPKHFDLLVAATKTVAKYDVEKEKYISPTYAMNMGTYLKQCSDIAILFALKRKNIAETVTSAEAEADLKTLIKVIESQWQYEISTQAASDLSMKKWNKITLVPLASDLKLLKDHLISEANLALKALENNGTVEDYRVLLETVFCRVILLNRRRPGELQRVKLDTYEMNNLNSTYEEFSEVVTPTQKILLSRFKRIVIRGKRGRGVPVLFNPDTQEHIKILLRFRDKFVSKKNLFLFGNPNTTEPICGYKVLKTYAVKSGTKNPNAITATRLRKHLATLTQIFDMSENDLEQLANFMGHSLGVHRANYRLPDDIFQTAKISKLLILMEKGEAGQFKGKNLNDIDLNLEEDLIEENMREEIQRSSPPPPEILPNEIFTAPVENDEPKKTNKKRNTRVLIKWTDEQKKLVHKFFKNHIRNKRPPKRHECEELKDLYPGIFDNKDWPKIKVFVQNQYQKI